MKIPGSSLAVIVPFLKRFVGATESAEAIGDEHNGATGFDLMFDNSCWETIINFKAGIINIAQPCV